MNKNDFKDIEYSLKSRNLALGSKIYFYENVPSTMHVAKALAAQGCEAGTTIVASAQNGGRGRLGRAWSSPEGGLWMSIILHPTIPSDEIPLVTLASAVGVCRAIEKLYNLTPGLKWPNDVIIKGKKVCGILTEGCVESNKLLYAVVGIGVNLNFNSQLLPDELKSSATTLLDESGFIIEQKDFLLQLLIELNILYNELANNKLHVLNLWKQYTITLGKEVTASYNNRTIIGLAKDITQDGSLVIKTETGEEIEVCSGEVTLRVMDTQ